MSDPKKVFDATVNGIHIRLYDNGDWESVSEDGLAVLMPFSFPQWALAAYIATLAAKDEQIAALTAKLEAAQAALRSITTVRRDGSVSTHGHSYGRTAKWEHSEAVRLAHAATDGGEGGK